MTEMLARRMVELFVETRSRREEVLWVGEGMGRFDFEPGEVSCWLDFQVAKTSHCD